MLNVGDLFIIDDDSYIWTIGTHPSSNMNEPLLNGDFCIILELIPPHKNGTRPGLYYCLLKHGKQKLRIFNT